MGSRWFAVVVAGVPRSGTSLAMQMLRAGGMPVLADDTRPPDEDNPRGYLEFAPARRPARGAAWLDEALGRAVKIVHALVPELPEDRAYRVVLMRRHWEEVLASQRAMLLRRGETVDDLSDDRLVAVYRGQLDRVVRWAQERPERALLEVDYADLLADPDRWAAHMAEFVGGGLDVDAMAAVVDPGLHRQRSARSPRSGPSDRY